MNFLHKIILCVVFVTPSLVSAHPDFSRPHISVSGNAVKEVSPDIVVWSLSLRSEGKKPDDLAMQHANRLSGLLSYLNQQGIKKDKVQTQHMQLSENWNYNNGKRFKQGYFASSSISFTSSIVVYAELWKGLASQDGVSVSGSQFDIENRIPIQVEARNSALQAAKEKAELDRELNKRKEEQAKQKAISAEIDQLITTNCIKRSDECEIVYNFEHRKKVNRIYINDEMKHKIIAGTLGIARIDGRYELIPKLIAEKIQKRNEKRVILFENEEQISDENDPYAEFKVPDDLIW